MQLAISVLGNQTTGFMIELLSAASTCHCNIVEFHTFNQIRLTSMYLLIEGNWNHVAKLENLLEALRNRHSVQIQLLRPDDQEPSLPLPQGVPYTLETLSTDRRDVLFAVTQFIVDRGLIVEEITASRHVTSTFDQQIFITRFVVLVPDKVRILSLREEFLDFCDGMNIDAILEPIKR